MTEYALILISTVLVNNFVLVKFLGLCPFIGVTKKTSSAFGMGIAVTFVMTLASVVTWLLYSHILLPNGLADRYRTRDHGPARRGLQGRHVREQPDTGIMAGEERRARKRWRSRREAI